jgi:hypothetical protein
MSTPEEYPKPTVRYRWTVGAAVVAIIGLVILTISGLCTGVTGFGMLYAVFSESGSSSANEWATLLGTLGIVAIFGGIPMIVGFLILRSGWKMRKRE